MTRRISVAWCRKTRPVEPAASTFPPEMTGE